jgi:flagellar motor component MotA
MYLIGIVAFAISFLLPLTFKGVPYSTLANPAVVTAILFTVVSTLIATSNFKLFTRGFNAVISRKYYLPETERLKAADLFRLLSKVTIAAACFGVFAGIIAMLGHMDDTEALGHALAAALVSPVLGAAVPIMFFEPAAFVLRHRAETEAGAARMKAYPKALGDKLLELCYQNGLSAEDIEKATDIELR